MTAILTGAGSALLVLLAGSLPRAGFGRLSGLSAWNLRVGISLPWAIAPMAIYLWAYFGFIGGRWGGSEAEHRRTNLRANRLPFNLWLTTLLAGLLGFAAILALLAVVARIVSLPPGEAIDAPAGMPAATMFVLLAMQSVVAGVSEESAFRGYMQRIVSRRFGEAAAIVAAGVFFGLLHFPNHPADVLVMLPYYVAVSAMYGVLTWAADSILPALVLHCVGDAVVLTRWWLTGLPEWQLDALPRALIWESGVDSALAVALFAAISLAGLTAWSFARVRRQRLALQHLAASNS